MTQRSETAQPYPEAHMVLKTEILNECRGHEAMLDSMERAANRALDVIGEMERNLVGRLEGIRREKAEAEFFVLQVRQEKQFLVLDDFAQPVKAEAATR